MTFGMEYMECYVQSTLANIVVHPLESRTWTLCSHKTDRPMFLAIRYSCFKRVENLFCLAFAGFVSCFFHLQHSLVGHVAIKLSIFDTCGDVSAIAE